MAYNKEKFQLTQLLQDVWYRLGQMKRWKVTGGSTTSVVNSAWAGVEEPVYEDDDPALIFGTVVVIEDNGGLGAAPEGEFGRITDYDSASTTITMDALTSGVAVNDRVGIASPLFPAEDLIEAANLALSRFGEVDVPDTSLSASAGVTEYTLPAAIRQRPLRVNIQTSQDVSDFQWKPVQGWSVIPATAGSQWTLVLPLMTEGMAIQVIYRAPHPRLNSYSSDILDSIHPELAICATLVEALQWYNNQVGGSNQYFLQRENKALQDLESAIVRYPIPRIIEQFQGMPHWGSRGEYVPGTSDLRGY